MNLASIVDKHDASRPAIISRGRTTTYGELRDQIEAFRGSLAELGVERGDRVALMCGNGRWFAVAYLAVVGAGAIAVPLNPLSPTPELETELAIVDPKVVLVEASGVPSFSGVDRRLLTSLVSLVVTDASSSSSLQGSTKIRTFDEMLAGPAKRWLDVNGEDPAVLIFTSGTAGSPKAAILTHLNLLENICQNFSTSDHIRDGDVVFGVLPMYHIFGLNVVLGMSLMAGACVVLVQRFDPVTALETFVDRKVTIVPGAPPIWIAMSLMDGVDIGLLDGSIGSHRCGAHARRGHRTFADQIRGGSPRGIRTHRGRAGGDQLRRCSKSSGFCRSCRRGCRRANRRRERQRRARR